MNSRPAVGVVMPVFNGEKYLKSSIESILGQTFTNFEFVIVNDGSTDGSCDILNDYAKLDPRIEVIEQSNAGISRATNVAIQRLSLSARYVAPTDQDDISFPQFHLQNDAVLQVDGDRM